MLPAGNVWFILIEEFWRGRAQHVEGVFQLVEAPVRRQHDHGHLGPGGVPAVQAGSRGVRIPGDGQLVDQDLGGAGHLGRAGGGIRREHGVDSGPEAQVLQGAAVERSHAREVEGDPPRGHCAGLDRVR